MKDFKLQDMSFKFVKTSYVVQPRQRDLKTAVCNTFLSYHSFLI